MYSGLSFLDRVKRLSGPLHQFSTRGASSLSAQQMVNSTVDIPVRSGSFFWRIVLLPEVGFDSQLIHTVNDDAEVMTENLAKRFVYLSRFRPAAQVWLKLALNHRERALDVAAFVVVGFEPLNVQ